MQNSTHLTKIRRASHAYGKLHRGYIEYFVNSNGNLSDDVLEILERAEEAGFTLYSEQIAEFYREHWATVGEWHLEITGEHVRDAINFYGGDKIPNTLDAFAWGAYIGGLFEYVREVVQAPQDK